MDNLFHIFKISLEDARKIAESPDSLHNHYFEELIVGIDGELEHFIDFKAERFVRQRLCTMNLLTINNN